MTTETYLKALLFYNLTRDILASQLLRDAAGYVHHGAANSVYSHCVRTAWCAFRLCQVFHVCDSHTRSVVRAALVHDLFGYDWEQCDGAGHWLLHPKRVSHAYHHGLEACQCAGKLFRLNERQLDAIRKHMWPTYPVPPVYTDGWLLTLADKLTAIKELCLSFGMKHGMAVKPPLLVRAGLA